VSEKSVERLIVTLGLTTSIIEGGGVGFVVDIQTLCDSPLDEPCDG
jgi:hypothetical protein